jgi:hypothetical protein
VVQERACGGVDAHLLADPLDVEAVEGAHRAVRLAFGGPESGEVVPAREGLRRLLHQGRVERPGHVPDPAGLERRRRAAVEDAVQIGPPGRRQARMEPVRDGLDRQHRDGLRAQMRVRGVAHGIRAPVAGEIDVHDLMGRVHAGVGAPSTMNPHRMTAEALDGLLDRLLHRAPVDLPLPARERGAVILDDELVARHHARSAKAPA